MVHKYDLVVVGGGNGGLMAACRAAKLGLKTLVIEKNNTVGGAAASFIRGRFEFEATLHEIPDFGEGEHRGNLGRLFDELGIKVEWLPIKDAFRVIVADGKNVSLDATVPHGRDEFTAYMEKECPGCTPSLERFFEAADKLEKGLEYIGLTRGKPDKEVLKKDYGAFCKLFGCSAGEFFRAIEMPQKCIDIISAYWPYQGSDIETIDASRYLLMTSGYFTNGAFIPKMRSHEVANSIQKRARELGCDFWLGTEVTKIITKSGAVCGVETADGKKVRAAAVISNTFPDLVYGKLLDNRALIPKYELKKANAREYGYRGFCCYMGLDVPPEKLGIKDYTTFIFTSADTEKLVKRCKSKDGAEDNISATCLNIANPDASPAGTTHLVLTTGFTDEAWGDITPESYAKEKNRVADAMIARYEEVTGIDLRGHIEEISVASPITFARYMNTPQGSIYGYNSSRWDGMSSRTIAEGAEKTVPGLWFVGAHGQRLSGFLPALTNGDLVAKQVMGYVMGGAVR